MIRAALDKRAPEEAHAEGAESWCVAYNEKAALDGVLSIRFIQQPSTTTINNAIAPAVTVEITGATNARVLGVAAVTISGTGIVTQRVFTVNGVATFSNLVPTSAAIGRTLSVQTRRSTDFAQLNGVSAQYTVAP